MTPFTLSEIKKRIQRYPKIELIRLPTPFYKLNNLSKILRGPEIFIKRDDLTGLAFGGNKSRKLEYIIQDALSKKADAIVTWASVQSNWCLQTAASARQFGITPILILFKTYDLPEEVDGNLLLDFILEADTRIFEAEKGKIIREADLEDIFKEVTKEAKERSQSIYIAPIGGSLVGGSMDKPLGAISYVNAVVEVLEQSRSLGFEPDYIIHATGSGGTQAGLIAGAKALCGKLKVLGVCVLDEKDILEEDVSMIAQDTASALELDIKIEDNDVKIFGEYIREGYGVVNKEVAEAIRMTAINEGFFLDPVYTGKAMAALFDLVQKGYFSENDRVVFIHTGGTPALFPNKHLLKKFL